MTSKIIFRQANRGDINKLTQLAVKTFTIAFGESVSPEELSIQLKNNLSEERIGNYITKDIVLLAESNSEIIGYVHLSEIAIEINTPTQESKSLQRLYIHPDYQNQGIGSTLIQNAIKHPFLKDIRYIYLDVWEKNLAAIRFYRRHGFKRVGEIRFIHIDGTEGDLDYIMQYDRVHNDKWLPT